MLRSMSRVHTKAMDGWMERRKHAEALGRENNRQEATTASPPTTPNNTAFTNNNNNIKSPTFHMPWLAVSTQTSWEYE